MTIWLHPWTSKAVYCPFDGRPHLRQDCQSLQLVKSLYSIANGGWGGTGFGRGTFTTTDGHALIPYLNTDFIYSAIAQEVGLIGVGRVPARLHALPRSAASGSRCAPTTGSRSSPRPG